MQDKFRLETGGPQVKYLLPGYSSYLAEAVWPTSNASPISRYSNKVIPGLVGFSNVFKHNAWKF
jgi:hypothetical protein